MWGTSSNGPKLGKSKRAGRLAVNRRPSLVERLEQRVVPSNAIPSVSLSVPAQALIGTTVDFSVGFTNTSPTQVGYGPYVDLFLPKVGQDGNDGISFASASYLGSSVTSTVLTFNANGQATHPYAKNSSGNPVVITGTPGDQLVVLLLPFGSFTPGQPTATVQVTANLSDLAALAKPLDITAEGGFEFGNDPLNDPTVDPSLIGAQTTASVTPTLVEVTTTYLGPENETATGPNFPEQYLVTATVAPGQTINDFDLTDILPSNLQFVSVDSASANGSSTQAVTSEPSTTVPGGTLTEQFDKVVGTGGSNDASLKFTFFVPRDDASANPVLDLNTGDFEPSLDQAYATGSWTPLNTTYPTTPVTSNTATDTLTDKSVAVQSTVTDLTNPTHPQPGDVLSYVLTFQVSDFFALANLISTDTFSDGQEFDGSITPTLTFAQHGTSFPAAALQTDNFSVGTQSTTDGTTPITFNISDELADRGLANGLILGASIPAGGTGGPIPSATPSFAGTVGTLTFHTIIQQQFNYAYPAGQPYFVEGDVLTNQVSLTGNILSYANLSNTETSKTDDSNTSLAVPRGALTETIYAINGNTSFTSPPKITAGDTVTYQMEYTLPTSNVDDMEITAFPPLPVFNATEITQFNNVSSAIAPVAGQAQFGPDDTYHTLSGIVPTLTTDSSANSIEFDYGTYHDPNQDTSVVDLLYTVTASNSPFADALFLTNQANETEGSTNNGTASANAIVQLELTEPVLKISKAAVAVNDPNAKLSANPYNFTAPGSSGARFTGTINSEDLAANPLNTSVSGIQAGDLVTFAIAVQNTGSGLNGAFNVTLRDTLPAGFDIPAGGINLNVSDGTGTTLQMTNVGSGTGLFDQGIEVTDPSGTAALSEYNATSGTNVLIVTYDLQADASVTPNEKITNTASLTNYSASEGGPDFLSTPETATASANTSAVTMTKSITDTNQGFTTGTDLAIGEIATYDVTVTIPEGVTPDAQLVDTLPTGLGVVSIDSITASTNFLTTSQGTFDDVLNSFTTVGSHGSSVTFNFGTITNADTVNTDTDTITIQYELAALNVAINSNNAVVKNSATFSYTGGSATASASATIVVPLIKLTTTSNKSSAQAGDTITYTLTLTNVPSNGSGTNAYNVNLNDLIPAGLDYQVGSLANTSGLVPTTLDDSSGAPVITFASFPLGESSVFTFQAIVDTSTGPYQTLTVTTNVTYTTLPSNITTSQSPYSSVATERTGSLADPGGTANNLSTSKTVNVATDLPTITKTIISTSLASTTGTNVAIGETVQYQVTVTIPNGTDADASLTDTLPSGLTLVGLDSMSVSGQLSTSIPGGFAGVFQDASIGATGESISLDLGTITNTNLDDSSPQSISLTYTAVVLNTAGNQAGTSLPNSVTYAVQGGSASASAPALNVVTPVLKLTESANLLTAQAGDTVTYTVTVANSATNGSGEDAYNVNLADVFPAGLDYVVGSLQNTSGIAPTTSDDSSGQPIITFADLPLNSASTFTFQATLDTSTGPYQTLTDAVTATYTTLPSDLPTPESDYSDVSTERTGNTSDPGGNLNNLVVNNSVTVDTTDPSVTKSIVSTGLATTTGTNVAIGETVQYQVTIVVPDGTEPDASLTDDFPAGMAFVSLDSLSMSAPVSLTGSPAIPTIGTDGQSMTLDFGTITNTDLNSATSETIVVTFTTVVLNVATNQAGTTLQNSVTYTVQGGSQSASASALTVVEPNLQVSLNASSAYGDAGGTPITFTAVVSAHAGTGADAFNTVFTDLIPSGYVYVPNSFVNTLGQVPTSISDTAGSLTAEFDDLAPGATSTLIFQAILAGNTTPGQTVSDSAAITYASLPGSVATPQSTYNPVSTQRTGNPVDPGGALNDYQSSASANVTLYSNSIAGVAFIDPNDTGIYTSGESLLAEVPITLSGQDNLGNLVSLTTSTNAAGAYSFTGLRPGNYTITATTPTGYLTGLDAAGTPFGGTNSPLGSLSSIAIPLGQNSAGTSYNFAELLPSSLAGFVFNDVNDNGLKDASEPGLSTVTVTLTGLDDIDQPVSLTTTTAADGTFQFANLRPGTYQLTEAPPTGYLSGTNQAGTQGGVVGATTIGSIDLTTNVAATAYSFADVLPVSLTGHVYVDLSDTGIYSPSDPGLGAVQVTLTGTDDHGSSVQITTTTASNGFYSFTGLRPGVYDLTKTRVPTYADGNAAPGSAGGTTGTNTVNVNPLPPAESDLDSSFGEIPGTISGVVFVDVQKTGTFQSGDPIIPGASISLENASHHVVQTTTTDAKGLYQFRLLAAGSYTVVMNAVTQNTGPVQQSEVANVPPGGPALAPFSVPVAVGNLTGSVFVDQNDDGLRNPSEPGLGGVTVTLKGVDIHGNAITRVTTTNNSGAYAFTSLPQGIFTVTDSRPAAYLVGKGGDSVAGLIVTAGSTTTARPIAVLPPSSISGLVYLDANGNDLLDPNEFGIAHVDVTLSGTNDLGKSILLSTVTNANGDYYFTNLRPGTYAVSRSATPDFAPGGENVGSLGGSIAASNLVAIRLTPGEQGQNYDFNARIKPGCELTTPLLHVALMEGPHPAGPIVHMPKLPANAYPRIRYWLPTLAERLGLTPSDTPTLVTAKSSKS